MDPLDRMLSDIQRDLRALRSEGDHEPETRAPSRYIGAHGSESIAEKLASGEYTVAERKGWSGSTGRKAGGLVSTMRKALAEGTASSGGYLVPIEVHDEVVRLLRTQSAVIGMRGVRVVPVKKELDVTYLSTGASAFWASENSLAAISEETFTQSALLRPRDLVCMVPVSDRLLRDAADSPDVEDVVTQDMAEVIGLRADLSFLRGTGAASEPTGIRNIAGVNVVSSGVNGATPTYDSLMDLVSPHRTANSRFDSPGWIFNGRLLTTLEKVKDTNGRYLKEAGLLEFDPTGNTGKLLGFPFRVSNQIPVTLTTGSSSDCSEIYFSSSWSEAWIGQEQTLAIDVSREASYWDGSAWVSAWTNRQHVFRAVWTVDFNLRRPGLFSVLTGVRP